MDYCFILMQMIFHSSVTLPRRDFIRPRRVLLSSRLCRALSVGAVGRLTFLVTVTLLINSCRRCRASARFFSRVLYLPALMITTPSLLMRRSLRFSRRCLYNSGSDEARISKRRCIAVETLLTFCPPAPRARTAEISISSSGTDILREAIFRSRPTGNSRSISCHGRRSPCPVLPPSR